MRFIVNNLYTENGKVYRKNSKEEYIEVKASYEKVNGDKVIITKCKSVRNRVIVHKSGKVELVTKVNRRFEYNETNAYNIIRDRYGIDAKHLKPLVYNRRCFDGYHISTSGVIYGLKNTPVAIYNKHGDKQEKIYKAVSECYDINGKRVVVCIANAMMQTFKPHDYRPNCKVGAVDGNTHNLHLSNICMIHKDFKFNEEDMSMIIKTIDSVMEVKEVVLKIMKRTGMSYNRISVLVGAVRRFYKEHGILSDECRILSNYYKRCSYANKNGLPYPNVPILQ